jgi:hypothetical protein
MINDLSEEELKTSSGMRSFLFEHVFRLTSQVNTCPIRLED